MASRDELSRVAEIAPVKVGIDFKELAVADDGARIAANAFVDRVEQPTAAHDDVAGSDLRLNLPESECSREQDSNPTRSHSDRLAQTG